VINIIPCADITRNGTIHARLKILNRLTFAETKTGRNRLLKALYVEGKEAIIFTGK
jgi:hypothetical protein